MFVVVATKQVGQAKRLFNCSVSPSVNDLNFGCQFVQHNIAIVLQSETYDALVAEDPVTMNLKVFILNGWRIRLDGIDVTSCCSDTHIRGRSISMPIVPHENRKWDAYAEKQSNRQKIVELWWLLLRGDGRDYYANPARGESIGY